jgi:hypothetical protein
MSSNRVRMAVRSAELAAEGTARVEHVCGLAADSLQVDGVGVSVTAGPGRHSRVAATDVVSGRIEDLQVLLGQGPCVDAVSSGAPVLVDDITRQEVADRWPVFAPEAQAIGVRASFALPLVVGGLRLGAMDLYRTRVGPLGDRAVAEAQDYATAVVELLLHLQNAVPDAVRTTLEPGWAATSVVHQATGMVMVQLGMDGTSAFAALRARAFQERRTLQEVAHDVLERRTRLDGEEV